MIDFFGVTPAQLGQVLGGSGRAKEPWRCLQKGLDPFAPEVLPARAHARLTSLCRGACATIIERRQASCGTIKLGLELSDGRWVEMVIIPAAARSTACLSVQVGCGRGCTFCVTATLGLVRSLTAAEIVYQVELARREVARANLPALRNVVYMGMGEPLDNLEAVARSIAILTDPHTFAVPPRHITVSTVGPSSRAIWAARQLPVQLAWSLHAVDDQVRRTLVPSMRETVAQLRDAFVRVVGHRRAILFVEISLIRGKNDAVEHATALADFLAVFGRKVRVNLLPLNPGREGLTPSSADTIERYQAVLRARGVFCMVRRPRGLEQAAACGQLAMGQKMFAPLASAAHRS